MPVGIQCPISSSLALGEFPRYWDWLWCPGLSPFPSPSILGVFHSLLSASYLPLDFNRVSSVYGRRIATHSVDPSLPHFLGEFPGLGLALVPDVVVPEADSGAIRKTPSKFLPLLRYNLS